MCERSHGGPNCSYSECAKLGFWCENDRHDGTSVCDADGRDSGARRRHGYGAWQRQLDVVVDVNGPRAHNTPAHSADIHAWPQHGHPAFGCITVPHSGTSGQSAHRPCQLQCRPSAGRCRVNGPVEREWIRSRQRIDSGDAACPNGSAVAAANHCIRQSASTANARHFSATVHFWSVCYQLFTVEQPAVSVFLNYLTFLPRI